MIAYADLEKLYIASTKNKRFLINKDLQSIKEFGKVTAISFSMDNLQLALGFDKGNIIILEFNE